MDMNLLALKIDPGTAAAQLDQFTTKLRTTETQSQQTQASFTALNAAFKSMAQAMQQEQTALARIPLNNLAQGFGQLGEMMGRVQAVQDRLARQNDPLAQGFARVAQQIQREQDVLMSIRAPQMEYFDTLTALDKLLDKNAISTAEYAAEVTKLNQSMEKTPAGGGGGLMGQLGGLGAVGGAAGGVLGAFAGGGVVAGLGAGISAIRDYVVEQRELEDEYTNLTNHEMKFVDGTHSLLEVQAQQIALARDLHTTMKEGVAVYDAVGDALVDMNLSSADLVGITKTVGQEAVISGKSMESAGDVLNRMTLAMDSGANAGRALKQALVGYDAITDTLTAHFHTTRAGLIALVDAHKVGSKDIVEALKAEAGQVQKNFDQRKVTNEQEKAMIEERINLYRQEGASRFDAELMASNKAYADFGEQMHRYTDEQYNQQQALAKTLPTIEQLTKDLENQSGAFQKVGDVERSMVDKMVDDLNRATAGVQQLGNAVSSALGRDAWAGLDDKTGLLKFLPLGIKTAMDFSAAVGQNKKQIDDLNAAYAAGGMSTADYLKSLEGLTQGIAAQKAGLADLANDGTKTMKKYTDTVYEAKRALADLEAAAGHMDAATFRNQRDSLETTINGRLPETIKLFEEFHDPVDQAHRDLAALDTLLKQDKLSWDQYAEGVARAQAALTKYEQYAPSVTGGHFAVPTPDGISDDTLFRASYRSAQTPDPKAYAEFEARARDALSGVDEGWKQIIHDSTDSAKQIKEAMTGALKDVQQSIEDMVLSGKLDLSSLGDELEKLAVHLAVQQATGGLIGLIGGGMTGFDFLTPGSGGRHVFPGFQGGGDMTVGGAGAPDSKLAIFRVSPGESIHVRTPEQRAATASTQGGDTTNNYNFMYDPKAMVRGGIDAMQAHMRANPSLYRALLGI